MNTTLHAHVVTASSDCDGRHGSDYIETLTDEEMAHHLAANGVNDFHDLMFKARLLSGHVSFSPLDKVQVEVSEYGFSMYETTEEGVRTAEVTWCEDDCDTGQGSQYDQFAEMMGY